MNNASWRLEDFVDSLVVELDKTRETLAVKAINKPLTYTVRDLALDLNIFPTYDGDQITFLTAQPGQEGASKVTIQLGTITDQQVRATSKPPTSKGEVKLETIDLDKATKKKLRKIGITSAEDLKSVERKNVDIQQVTDNEIDYGSLANKIEKSRRAKQPPVVRTASLEADEDAQPCLVIRGEKLAVNPHFAPVAVIDGKLADVMSSSDSELRIRADPTRLARAAELVLVTDPFAVTRVHFHQGATLQ